MKILVLGTASGLDGNLFVISSEYQKINCREQVVVQRGTLELIACAWHRRFCFDRIYTRDNHLGLRAACLRRLLCISGIQPEFALLFSEFPKHVSLILPTLKSRTIYSASCLLAFAEHAKLPIKISSKVLYSDADLERFISKNKFDTRMFAQVFVEAPIYSICVFVENKRIVYSWAFKTNQLITTCLGPRESVEVVNSVKKVLMTLSNVQTGAETLSIRRADATGKQIGDDAICCAEKMVLYCDFVMIKDSAVLEYPEKYTKNCLAAKSLMLYPPDNIVDLISRMYQLDFGRLAFRFECGLPLFVDIPKCIPHVADAIIPRMKNEHAKVPKRNAFPNPHQSIDGIRVEYFTEGKYLARFVAENRLPGRTRADINAVLEDCIGWFMRSVRYTNFTPNNSLEKIYHGKCATLLRSIAKQKIESMQIIVVERKDPMLRLVLKKLKKLEESKLQLVKLPLRRPSFCVMADRIVKREWSWLKEQKSTLTVEGNSAHAVQLRLKKEHLDPVHRFLCNYGKQGSSIVAIDQ